VSLVDVVCCRELGRRSRSHLDLTAQITPGFCISRNRDSYCIVSLTFPKRDPRNSDQWFRCDLDLTAQITSGFCISRNQDSYCIVSLTFPKRDPRNSDQRFRCDLDLTAQITSSFCEPSTPCTFKDRAGFPQSNGGRTLRLDLTPLTSISPPVKLVVHVTFSYMTVAKPPHRGFRLSHVETCMFSGFNPSNPDALFTH
jgi:hypothetical protein